MTTKGRGPSSPINGTAPEALTSNQVVNLGALVAVVIGDVASGAQAALATEGVFSLAKESGFAIAQGSPVYFDTGVQQRAENNEALPCIGYATEAAGSSATSVTVRLAPVVEPTSGLSKKNNLNAAARPTVDDDATEGYSIGSEWQYLGVRWICHGVGTGAAKWRPLNPIIAEVTVASGQTAIVTAISGLVGVANGDPVIASVKTKGANAAYIVSAAVAGGNLTVTVDTDPGAGGAVCNAAIWPAAVG